MNKSFKYRIYPTKSQKVLLNKTFGTVRYYWNQQVAVFNTYNKETNPNPEYKTSTQMRNEIEWMKEVSASPLQQKERDFIEFKRQLFSKNRSKKLGFPKFKSKHDKQSYRLPNQKFQLIGNKIRLEKIGWIKLVLDREIPCNSKFLSVTVSKNKVGRYFVSVLVDCEISHKPKTSKEIGIDLGLKEFLVQSDNVFVANPKFFRDSQARLKRMQQHFSRKKKGSVRHKKCRIKVARIYNKITNQREWFLHNESTRIINDYDSIFIEDLNVSGMIKNHKLAKSIADASWSKFTSMLEYKAKWYGKEVVKIGRFEKSSKTCSNCGWINDSLTLKDRVFSCPVCGLEIDRDLNAGINIKAFGVANAQRTQSDSKTSSEANHVEAFIIN